MSHVAEPVGVVDDRCASLRARAPGTMDRPRVIIFTSYYLPGYRAGGPIKAIAAAIEALQEEYEVILVTRDRDVGSRVPYSCAGAAAVNDRGATIHYLSPGPARILAIGRLIHRYRPAVVYLNSAFDPLFTLVPLLWLKFCRRAGRPAVAVAPRGEFAAGALALKGPKKRLYLIVSRRLRLYGGSVWQATAAKEALEIQHVMRVKEANVVVVPDPPATARAGRYAVCPEERSGPLRVVFLARIVPMKNLEGALRILKDVAEPVDFSICGPIEDQQYWSTCRLLMARLPDHVSVNYRGPVRPEQVADVFLEQDLLLLPTFGESFGHVICEAWAGWCPVLISDRTPWRDLQRRGVGWDVPLEKPESFVDLIGRCARMPASEYQRFKRCARSYAEELSASDQTQISLRTLFARAVSHEAVRAR